GPATEEVVEASDGRGQPGDEVGLSGLQARYDDLLRGTATVLVTAVDAAGCPEWPVCEDAPERTLVELPGEEPQDLRLTLDPQLQLKAERILHADADEDPPPSAIVALRAPTGAVLAAANGPGGGSPRPSGSSTPTPARRPRRVRSWRCARRPARRPPPPTDGAAAGSTPPPRASTPPGRRSRWSPPSPSFARA